MGSHTVPDKAFSMRGIYELGKSTDTSTGAEADNGYHYYYLIIDTSDGVTSAQCFYSPSDNPNSLSKKTVTFTHSEDFDTLTLDGKCWTLSPNYGTYYVLTEGDVEHKLVRISYEVTEQALMELIEDKLPEIID